jgi:ATP-dependent Clp protease ATP-binding subunit ClpX
MLQYGFIPEMVGRLPVMVSLESLDRDSLIRILTEPKNAIIKQYQQLFSMDGVELEFTTEGLEAAAERALAHQTGARSLRYIIEETLLDVMYELPSLSGVVRCQVGREAVYGNTDPNLIDANGEILDLYLGPVQKSA